MAKAPKTSTAVVATANHLRSGAVLFLAGSGAWTTRVAEARVAQGPEAAERLLAQAKTDPIAVDPVLIEVIVVDGAAQPASLRERIRASGPTAETVAPRESAHVSV